MRARSFLAISTGVLAMVVGCLSVFSIFECSRFAASGEKATEEVTAEAKSSDDPHGGRFLTLVAQGAESMAEQRWEAAAEILRRAAEMEPSSEEAVFMLGTALIQLEHYKDALAVLGPLLERGVRSASLKNNVAWAYIKAPDSAVRNVRMALRYAREAVIEDHRDPNIWGTLAEVHYVAGNYDEALRAAQIATRSALESRAGNIWEYSELLRRCRRAMPGVGPTVAGNNSEGDGRENNTEH